MTVPSRILPPIESEKDFPYYHWRIDSKFVFLPLVARVWSQRRTELGFGLIVGTLIILVTFLIISGAFTGIGLLVRRGFGPRPTNIDHYFLAFWTGYGVVLLLLILWNFIMPIGFGALLTVFLLGGLGWWLGGSPARFVAAGRWRPKPFHVVFFAVGSLWVANQSTAPMHSWDDGLYHLQGVQWAETYPVVPGIANLLGPLGFNNASFLYDAMLDSGWWKDRGFHIANGLLMFVMVLQASVAGTRIATRFSSARGLHLYQFLMLAPTLSLARNGGLATYSTDIPSGLLLLAASGWMYQLLNADPSSDDGEDAYLLVALTILFAAAVCVKMTAAVFTGVGMSMVAFLWWKRRGRSGRLISNFGAMALIALSFALPWMFRGVVMSGYPLFPLSVGGAAVAWRAPLEHVQAEYSYIGYSEREFSWHFIGHDWLLQVFEKDIYSVLVPALLTALALIILAFSKRARAQALTISSHAWWILLPTLVSIGAWLLSAPSTRYSRVLFWILAATSVCNVLQILWPHLEERGKAWLLIGVFALGISSPFVEPALAAILRGENPVVAILKYNVIFPDSGQWVSTMPHSPEVISYTTRYGLEVNVPRKPQGQETFAKCWNAPLPCTPTPAPNLRLIEPGRLERGFRVEGGWEMVDWPGYWQSQFLPEWRKRRQTSGVLR